MSEPFRRPLLVTFHCGAFFIPFAVFVTSIGRRDVEETFTQHFGPDYIGTMLLLMVCCFAGYIALWNLRRSALLILLVSGVPLLVLGLQTGAVSLVHYLPLIACLTSLPLWPVLK